MSKVGQHRCGDQPPCVLQMGAVMMATGAYNTLTLMSQEEGRHMDSPESVKV